MNRKRKCILLAVLLSALVFLNACGGQTPSHSRHDGTKTFIFGDTTFNAENGIADINPHNSSGGWGCIRYGVGETLFRFTDSMEMEPWLAENWEHTDDVTWKIEIKEGITFTSGRKVDAAAVKECLEALMEAHPRAAGNLHIKAMEAGEQTLTIRTDIPVPALPSYLADPYSCIIDMEEGVDEDGIVCGTGPYEAVSLETDQRLVLVKNKNYWDGEPNIDTLIIRNISDGDTLTAALQSGEIDAAYGIPYLSYPLFENENYIFTGCSTSRVFFGAMNFESPITSDPAVRKAIAMGIDKEGFVKALMNGNGEAASGVYPENFSFGGKMVHTETYDPEEAKAVLEEAGWTDRDGDGVREKDGVPLVLRWLTYPSRQELPLLAESAQATLGEIGIRVEINNTPDHSSVCADKNAWDIYVSAMVTAPTGDPEYFFNYHCLDSSAHNDGGYHSDRLEALAQKLSGTFDTEKRAKLAVRMQQTLLDDNACVFVAHLRMNMIARAGVTGLTAHPCDYYEITAELDVK